MGFLDDVSVALNKPDNKETPKEAEFRENVRRLVDVYKTAKTQREDALAGKPVKPESGMAPSRSKK